jgi:selenocysteine lyase/cysteine desulfurase
MVKTAKSGLLGAAWLRSQMPVTHAYCYFDHAAGYLEQVTASGDCDWPEWARRVERGRQQAAELLSCGTDEIALVPNTTFGINVVAHGIRWKAGDNLVVSRREFPSNLLPWRLLERAGVEVRLVDGCDDQLTKRLCESIDRRTRIVTVSWVHYRHGYRTDLVAIGEAAHAQGARLMVDAIQGLGAFPLSLAEHPIDFLAADGHKWMLGPEGAGLLFIRRGGWEELDPLMMGWGSVDQAYRFDPEAMTLLPSAARYEGGSLNMAGMLGFAASLEVLLAAGCHRWESGMAATILELADYAAEGLRRLGAIVERHPDPRHRSGIVAFTLPPHDSSLLRQRLLQEKIVVSVRHGQLRAALHAYNTTQEIDRLLSVLAEA